MSTPKKSRGARNTGSVYFNKSKALWVGQLTVGYKPNGKPDKETVYGKTKTEVRIKLEALKVDVSIGKHINTEIVLCDYLRDTFLPTKALQVKPKTMEFYDYTVVSYIEPHFLKVKLKALKPLSIQNAINKLARDKSPQAANRMRRVLFTALEEAVKLQLVPTNPVKAIKPLKVEQAEMTIWSTSELSRFLTFAQNHRLYALFYLTISTGLRRGEVLGLQWKDLKANVIQVSRTLGYAKKELKLSSPKTKKGSRTVALSQDVLDVLAQHRLRQQNELELLGLEPDENTHIFLSEEATWIDPRNLTRTWHQLQKQAEVTRIRFHDLRHLSASLGIKMGMDAKMLADRLGHARASFTLDVYTHIFEEQREQSAVSLLAFTNPSNLPN